MAPSRKRLGEIIRKLDKARVRMNYEMRGQLPRSVTTDLDAVRTFLRTLEAVATDHEPFEDELVPNALTHRSDADPRDHHGIP